MTSHHRILTQPAGAGAGATPDDQPTQEIAPPLPFGVGGFPVGRRWRDPRQQWAAWWPSR